MQDVITVGALVKCLNPRMSKILKVTAINDDENLAFCESVSDNRKYTIKIEDLILA
jgi:hypothetical protein